MLLHVHEMWSLTLKAKAPVLENRRARLIRAKRLIPIIIFLEPYL